MGPCGGDQDQSVELPTETKITHREAKLEVVERTYNGSPKNGVIQAERALAGIPVNEPQSREFETDRDVASERRDHYQKGIREQYRTGSRLLDAIVTHYTAKPLPGQTPYFTPNARRAFWISAAGLFFFPAVVALLSLVSFWAAVVAAYVASVAMTGLFRKFQVEYGHHASHRAFVRGNRTENSLYLNIATTLAFCQNGDEYRKEHNEHHDRRIFTTDDDADAALLKKFGIRPGKSKRALWLTFLGNLVSPYFHGYFFVQRMKSNFLTRRPIAWRFASLAWLGLIVASLFVLPTWIALTTIILPLTIFYQMSALTQFVTEHAWMLTESAPKDTAVYASRCWGRFAGEALPKARFGPRALLWEWPGFVLRNIFLHYPTRYAVVVGDMPAHDWHHLAAYMGVSGHTWPAGIFERQRAIEAGDTYRMADRELWGIVSMLNHVFGLIADVNPVALTEKTQCANSNGLAA